MRPANMTVLGLLSLIIMGLIDLAMVGAGQTWLNFDHVILPAAAAPSWAGTDAEPFGLTLRLAIFGLATMAGYDFRQRHGLPVPGAEPQTGSEAIVDKLQEIRKSSGKEATL